MSDDAQRRKSDEAYKVGYGNPPRDTRFKPGQSGNPKGRQKGSKSFKATVGAILNEKIKVQTPQGTKRITKLEALVHTNLNNALKGDPKASDQVFRIAREAGLVEEVAEVFDKLTMQQLVEEDQAILERFARRHSDGEEDGA
ncbi:DUF5681 domain-containing protein [Xanthobacter sp. V3C-3]|uniref:DUF5681 domain-containing protein n=1 Tax=Xanthobacter lutulentifluminis TaxID=3119935 RepID=UPI003727D98D